LWRADEHEGLTDRGWDKRRAAAALAEIVADAEKGYEDGFLARSSARRHGREACAVRPVSRQRRKLVRENRDHPTSELMWRSPGTTLAWTADIGVALYLRACLDGDPRMPTFDYV
jgi:hypothetical protein